MAVDQNQWRVFGGLGPVHWRYGLGILIHGHMGQRHMRHGNSQLCHDQSPGGSLAAVPTTKVIRKQRVLSILILRGAAIFQPFFV